MSLRDRLASLAALKPARRARVATGDATAESVASGARGFSAALPDGAERLAELLQAKTLSNSFGEHLSVRRWFSEAIGFAPPEGSVNMKALRLLAPGACAEVADPRQWLLLDTETTGLMGGTGTYPFMVGIAWWDAGGLEVEQFFMRELSEEHALLVTLAQRMAERPVLVTFNGKSFDWPLLETRYRMTRKIRAICAARAFGFSASGAKFVARAAGIGAVGGIGKACVGVESRRGFDFGDDSTILFRLFARRAAGATGADLLAQSNGPARVGRACQPDRRGAGGPGVGQRGRVGIIWGFAHL